jgi:hypothetical protein
MQGKRAAHTMRAAHSARQERYPSILRKLNESIYLKFFLCDYINFDIQHLCGETVNYILGFKVYKLAD